MKRNDFYKKIGLEIRKRRRALDLTQSELARRTDAESAGYICDIEKGRKSFSAHRLHLLEQTLGPLLA